MATGECLKLTNGIRPFVYPQCSIIVSTFNRVEHVHQFLHTYANGALPHLDAIFISWVSYIQA